MTEENELNPTEYIGDAVYASFDGYHVNLTLNDHRSPRLIGLEPKVMEALIQFYKKHAKP